MARRKEDAADGFLCEKERRTSFCTGPAECVSCPRNPALRGGGDALGGLAVSGGRERRRLVDKAEEQSYKAHRKSLEAAADRLLREANQGQVRHTQDEPAYPESELRRRREDHGVVLASEVTRRKAREMREQAAPVKVNESGLERARRAQEGYLRGARIRFAVEASGMTGRQRTAVLLSRQEVTPYLISSVQECPDVMALLGIASADEVPERLQQMVGDSGWVTTENIAAALGVSRRAVEGWYERGGKRILEAVTDTKGKAEFLRQARAQVEEDMRRGVRPPSLASDLFEEAVQSVARDLQIEAMAPLYLRQARDVVQAEVEDGEVLTPDEFEEEVWYLARGFAEESLEEKEGDEDWEPGPVVIRDHGMWRQSDGDQSIYESLGIDGGDDNPYLQGGPND